MGGEKTNFYAAVCFLLYQPSFSLGPGFGTTYCNRSNATNSVAVLIMKVDGVHVWVCANQIYFVRMGLRSSHLILSRAHMGSHRDRHSARVGKQIVPAYQSGEEWQE